MSNMASRSVHTDGQNKAPGQEGRTDVAYENIQVECILWPEYDTVAEFLTQTSVAVKGEVYPVGHVDEEMVKDMFKGGLNQSLECFYVSFRCSGVSRGVTHQLVRTRKASFAQQSMRYADMDNFNVRMPEEISRQTHRIPGYWNTDIDWERYPRLYALLAHFDNMNENPERIWKESVEVAREAYRWLVEHNIPMQDARTVCPIATETYIVCSYPLNEFAATYAYRGCSMFYPETVAVFRKMRAALLLKCAWLEDYIRISCEKTSGSKAPGGHFCTYQGWERVEGQCEFPWALEENRTFKSRRVDK